MALPSRLVLYLIKTVDHSERYVLARNGCYLIQRMKYRSVRPKNLRFFSWRVTRCPKQSTLSSSIHCILCSVTRNKQYAGLPYQDYREYSRACGSAGNENVNTSLLSVNCHRSNAKRKVHIRVFNDRLFFRFSEFQGIDRLVAPGKYSALLPRDLRGRLRNIWHIFEKWRVYLVKQTRSSAM